jgi:hypothetical protein
MPAVLSHRSRVCVVPLGFMSVPSGIPLGLSALAVGISIYSVLSSRRRDRRDLYLSMQQHLIEPEMLEGRRLLFAEAKSVGHVRTLRESRREDYDKINRALSTFEQFGSYVLHGWIDRDLVLEEWGHTYAAVWRVGSHFIEERDSHQEGRWSGWNNLRQLGREAAEWCDDPTAYRRRRSRVRRFLRRIRGLR